MSTKKAAKATLTPREAALEKAKTLLEIETKIAALSEQAQEIKASLKEYCAETQDFDLEVYTVTESEAKPKLNFGSMTANAQKRVTEILMAELPEFVKSKSELDSERLYYSQSSNPAVKNALHVHGIHFDLVTTMTFRKVK